MSGGLVAEQCWGSQEGGWTADAGRAAAKELVLQAKEKIEDEVWTRLKTDEPELLTDVIKGRSITWEEVDSAEMPQFGERPPLERISAAVMMVVLLLQHY